jgi:hypothetical protein
MTLKEKFQQWFINDEEDEHYEGMVELVSIEHEKIAEEFAVEYAEWCCARAIGVTYFKLNEEELEQFKKEKGL